jgi:hypothetical protein
MSARSNSCILLQTLLKLHQQRQIKRFSSRRRSGNQVAPEGKVTTELGVPLFPPGGMMPPLPEISNLLLGRHLPVF